MVNKEVKKLTLVFQDIVSKEGDSMEAMFGMLELMPEKGKKKGEKINFISRLGEVKAFETQIKKIIKEALELKDGK